MKVYELATCINLYKSALDYSDFMVEVNAQLDNPWSEINWFPSAVGSSTVSVSNYRTSAESTIGHLEKSDTHLGKSFQKISNTILEKLLPDYRSEFLVATTGYEDWRLLKYAGGGEYHAHYDHSPDSRRIISVVAFLETPNAGGELEFPYFGVTVSPIAGDVLIFPSNFPYTHVAHPVTDGTKCSLVTWLQ